MRVGLMLTLLTVGGAYSSLEVRGQEGDNVTLSCRYNVATLGRRSVCWNWGDIPNFGCSPRLISTDGQTVLEGDGGAGGAGGSGGAGRYRLLGSLEDGDVSLTILRVRQEDSGRYGCRVDVPGWFNDDKHHVDLMVETCHTTEFLTTDTGSDVISVKPPMVAEHQDQHQHQQHQQQQQQQLERLQMFVGNTLRFSFIIFIPVLLLSLYYRVCGRGQTPKPKTDSSSVQSEQRAS